MGSNSQYKPMGRPKKELNQEQFETLCSFGLNVEQIASFFHVDADTVTAWCKRNYGETFSVVKKWFHTNMQVSLLQAQYKKAIHGNKGEGDSTMLIWLGKQVLGQTDKTEETVEERVQIVADLQDD